jgi:hypothetical protein
LAIKSKNFYCKNPDSNPSSYCKYIFFWIPNIFASRVWKDVSKYLLKFSFSNVSCNFITKKGRLYRRGMITIVVDTSVGCQYCKLQTMWCSLSNKKHLKMPIVRQFQFSHCSINRIFVLTCKISNSIIIFLNIFEFFYLFPLVWFF